MPGTATSFERDELLSFAQQLGSKLVVLAGDTHNAWTSQLTTTDGKIAGVEFGGTSVSSPGLDEVLGSVATASAFTSYVVNLVDDLVYANLVGRGYMHIEFTRETSKCHPPLCHHDRLQRVCRGRGRHEVVHREQGRYVGVVMRGARCRYHFGGVH